MSPVTSPLGFALLGLIHQEPRSGYDLRKIFATTPLMHFSDSPGAIYPALRRLRRKRLITTSVRPSRSGRHRQVFRVTPRGTRALRRWLQRPVSRADVVWHMDHVMLRFAFIGGVLSRSATIRFLEAFHGEIKSYVAELTKHYASAATRMPLSGRLALQSGMETYKSQARWARGAIRQLRRKRRIP